MTGAIEWGGPFAFQITFQATLTLSSGFMIYCKAFPIKKVALTPITGMIVLLIVIFSFFF